MKIAVIIPAAGAGKRFVAAGGPGAAGGAKGGSKIELDLAGKPVFLRAIELFLRRPVVERIILAVNPDAVEEFRFRWGDKLAFHGVQVVPGGKTERWETVLKALATVPESCTHVAVHDAARPMTGAKVIDRLFEAAEKYAAVLPGYAVANTLKEVQETTPEAQDKDPLDAILGSAGKSPIVVKRIVRTVDRSRLYEVQTPQVFEIGLLRRAYAQITEGKLDPRGITDDASLIEAMGQDVFVVESDATNLKITRPEDLVLAEAYLRATEQKDAAKLAKKRLFADEEE